MRARRSARNHPPWPLGQPLVEVRPDWERASELGLDVGDLGYSIWGLLRRRVRG